MNSALLDLCIPNLSPLLTSRELKNSHHRQCSVPSVCLRQTSQVPPYRTPNTGSTLFCPGVQLLRRESRIYLLALLLYGNVYSPTIISFCIVSMHGNNGPPNFFNSLQSPVHRSRMSSPDPLSGRSAMNSTMPIRSLKDAEGLLEVGTLFAGAAPTSHAVRLRVSRLAASSRYRDTALAHE
ncbi:uncharacterized protein LY89DRAFT_682420 [Mollisia scopiformis]|uniref:Uncharacterized protein n=1 Tax=Mollisia scopiformis TaxID=149040 RepID=A0A194XKP2_MOLSC|nr:uncharacterized protein LY89DRAFT_682420 [Mollisia scopiformis]KUJ20728.1 hypothetical protein LY89DRAFT_682420 [Mollisia scopiformis]